MKRLFLIIGLALLLSSSTFAQRDTTVSSNKVMIPVFLSAVLPGAGQIYNGKWWKVPFIYAGLGATYYLYINLDYQYRVLLQDIVTRQNGYSFGITNIQDINTLKSTKDQYRNWRDLTGIGFSLVWILNVVDAYVDSELKNFDVSPDLSFDSSTIYDITTGQAVPAFSVKVRF